MLELPWTHNIRRGAAADIASLEDASGNTNNRARRSLVHSMSSANHGATDAYIGYDARDSWAERIAASATTQQPTKPATIQSPFGLQMTAAQFRPTSLAGKPKIVDEWCDTHQLDKTDRLHRTRAVKAIHKSEREQWTDDQKSILAGEDHHDHEDHDDYDHDVQRPQTTTSEPAPRRMSLSEPAGYNNIHPQTTTSGRVPQMKNLLKPTGRSNIHPQTTTSGRVPSLPGRTPLQDTTNTSRPRFGLTTQSEQQPDFEQRSSSKTLTENDNIDPVLRIFTDSILGGSTASTVESLAEECVSLWAAAADAVSSSPRLQQDNDGELAVLASPQDQFITYFSTINLVRSSKDVKGLEDTPRGNSRDTPSNFLFYCHRTQDCQKSYRSERELAVHQVTCQQPPLPSKRPVSLALGDADTGDDDADTEDDDAFERPKRQRKQPELAFKAQSCPDSDACGVTTVFTKYRAYASHRQRCHDTDWPADTPCNVPGCKTDSVFQSRRTFQSHLCKVHLLDTAKRLEYTQKILPQTERRQRKPTPIQLAATAYTKTRCRVPNCKVAAKKTEYATISDYRRHLVREHGLRGDEQTQFLTAAHPE